MTGCLSVCASLSLSPPLQLHSSLCAALSPSCFHCERPSLIWTSTIAPKSSGGDLLAMSSRCHSSIFLAPPPSPAADSYSLPGAGTRNASLNSFSLHFMLAFICFPILLPRTGSFATLTYPHHVLCTFLLSDLDHGRRERIRNARLVFFPNCICICLPRLT